MDFNDVLIIIGYFLAIFFSFMGLLYGVILYYISDDARVKKHAKYIVIIAFILLFFVIILMAVMGISVLGLSLATM